MCRQVLAVGDDGCRRVRFPRPPGVALKLPFESAWPGKPFRRIYAQYSH